MNNAQPPRMHVSALSPRPGPRRARLEGGPVRPPAVRCPRPPPKRKWAEGGRRGRSNVAFQGGPRAGARPSSLSRPKGLQGPTDVLT